MTSKITQLLFLVCLIAIPIDIFAQDITFTFANAQNTNDGSDDYYEVDVMIESTSDFKLGVGLLYFNYNTSAFGSNVQAGGNLEITRPDGYILAEDITAFATDIYDSFLPVDNTSSRFSFSWNQAFSQTLYAGNNVTSTAKALLHIKIKYADVAQGPNVTFEGSGVFDDQTYTACGGGFTSDCTGSPGVQITNDTYDRTGADISITWDGSEGTDWNTAGNWASGSVPTGSNNVIVPANQVITASGNIDVKNLTLESGASLTIANNLNNTGNIIVKSGASIIAQNSSTFNLTYQRNLSTTNWYLVSSGVVNETIEDLISNHSFATGSSSNIGIGDYNNTAPGWTYATLASTGTIASGEGRAIKMASTGDISFSGSMPLSDVSITISDGTLSGGNGFNLIGNPFPSFMPVNNTSPSISNNILRANTDVLAQETIWVWDQSSNGYIAINQASALVEGNKFLAPGQGFFVQSDSDGGAFTFAESMQSHQTTDTFSRNNGNVPKIELTINENSNSSKKTNILYLANATKGWDNGFDSTLFDVASTSLTVYTHLVNDSQGQNLEIQSLPDNDYENMIIPVGINADEGMTIELVGDVSDFPQGINVYLEDRVTNTFTQLNTSSNTVYSVTLNENLQGIGRFYLHTTSSILSTPSEEFDNVNIYLTTPTNLQIRGIDSGKVNVELYSIQGKKVQQEEFVGLGVNNITLSKLSTGIYIIKLQAKKGRLTKKIIIE